MLAIDRAGNEQHARVVGQHSGQSHLHNAHLEKLGDRGLLCLEEPARVAVVGIGTSSSTTRTGRQTQVRAAKSLPRRAGKS